MRRGEERTGEEIAERGAKRTGPGWNSHADVGVDEDLAPRGHHRVPRRIDVVPSGKGTPPGRQAALIRQLLDEQRRRGLDFRDGRRGGLRACGHGGGGGGWVRFETFG